MNNVCLAGRLVKDGEMRFFESGKCVYTNTLAVSRTKDETDFIEIKAWEKTADLIGEHYKKGDHLVCSGSIQQETWEKDGQKRSKLLVVVRQISFGPKRNEPKNTEEQLLSEEEIPF